jgi:hypothetical protein
MLVFRTCVMVRQSYVCAKRNVIFNQQKTKLNSWHGLVKIANIKFRQKQFHMEFQNSERLLFISRDQQHADNALLLLSSVRDGADIRPCSSHILQLKCTVSHEMTVYAAEKLMLHQHASSRTLPTSFSVFSSPFNLFFFLFSFPFSVCIILAPLLFSSVCNDKLQIWALLAFAMSALNGYTFDFILESFSKVCQPNPILIKIGRQWRTLYTGHTCVSVGISGITR